MTKLSLSTPGLESSCEIIIGSDALDQLMPLVKQYSQVVIISGQNTAKHWLGSMKEDLPDSVKTIVFSSGEKNKNLKTVEEIHRRLKAFGCDRKSLIVGLGGGVTGDIAGFVASSYMRGIDWVALPTTSLAQADAAIGGKTGVNLDSYKNMVGSFWLPKAVLINPGFLSTLPRRHLINGLSEIIKMGIIYDKKILGLIENIDPENIVGNEFYKASELSARGKIEIVNEDMRESGKRKLLNFGHTIGHAVESVGLETNKPFLHGEAIAIGMVAETKLAELENVCQTGLADNITEVFERFGLPTTCKNIKAQQILSLIASDKKNVDKNIYWTLPTALGQGGFNYQAKPENIESAINFVTG